MIPTALALVVGAVVAAVLWLSVREWFEAEAFRRTNYRGAELVTGVGVVVPMAMIVVAGLTELIVRAADSTPSWAPLVAPSLAAGAGYSLLGVLDDLVGVGQSGGFRGHLRALADGRLTTGMFKLLGGAALGVVVASSVARGDEGVIGALRDGAVVALAANLANLFDRAPGRVIKVTVTGFVVAAAVARNPTLAAPGVGVGAGLGLLPADLSEKVMVGDAGANPLGALCGLAALVAAPAAGARWGLVVVLIGLNVVSEFVSFSRVIDTVAPLRWLDRFGSQRS